MNKAAEIIEFFIHNEEDPGLVVRGRVCIPVDGPRKISPVIIAPGFLGFADWGFYPHLAEKLLRSGYAALLFNYSTGGVGKSGKPYSDLKNLKRMTISHDLNDLNLIYNYISTDKTLSQKIDCENIGLIGHSKGGGVAIIHAKFNPAVKAIITINGIARFQRIPQEKVNRIIKRGSHEIQLNGMLNKFRFKADFWEDIEKNKDRYDILKALKKINAKCLFIQGERDDKVGVSEAGELHFVAGEKSDLMIIELADHNFGCDVFCSRLSDLADRTLDKAVQWLDKNIRNIPK